MKRQQDSFTSRGLTLYYQSWLPQTPRALLVISHGYAEHSGRYQHVAEHFVAQGIAVYALDHMGHGKSQGEVALLMDFQDVRADLDIFITKIKDNQPTLPLILLGHSMGGGLALTCVQHHPDKVDLLVCSAPYLIDGGDTPAFVISIGKVVSRVLPSLLTISLDSSLISRDPAVVKAYNDDPLVYSGKVKARTGDQLLAIGKSVLADPGKITLPILVMHGTADGIASVEGSKRLYEQLGSEDKTLKLYEGLYHEILNEPEQEQVLDDILAWLEARL